MTTSVLPWRQAWEEALYGPAGFFRIGRPGEHFRTNVHVPLFAEAVARLARRTGARSVVDVGSGGGELLAALHVLLGDSTELVGVEVAGRPVSLPDAVGWVHELPTAVDGLLVANEWLDNIPCDVVELDADGVLREVLVDPATGHEALGQPYASEWVDTWWPLDVPGARAEVGQARDDAWADAVSRVDGVAVAVDYGHRRSSRPALGSLRSYAAGREVDVVPDGTRDVTAHVAVDSLAARTGSVLARQRDELVRLGIDGSRPRIGLATSDPVGYVEALNRAGEAGELLARGGLGDFWWVTHDTRAPAPSRGTLVP